MIVLIFWDYVERLNVQMIRAIQVLRIHLLELEKVAMVSNLHCPHHRRPHDHLDHGHCHHHHHHDEHDHHLPSSHCELKGARAVQGLLQPLHNLSQGENLYPLFISIHLCRGNQNQNHHYYYKNIFCRGKCKAKISWGAIMAGEQITPLVIKIIKNIISWSRSLSPRSSRLSSWSQSLWW